jgi:hypothetical protein
MKAATWWWIAGIYGATVWITKEKGYPMPFTTGLVEYLKDLAAGRTTIDPRQYRPVSARTVEAARSGAIKPSTGPKRMETIRRGPGFTLERAGGGPVVPWGGE